MSCQIVICCGSGGVGKTTTSAALALKWAMGGDRVVVLTIDPARRLADSLNIGRIGGDPTPVPLPDTAGSLDAVMLDVQATFEGLIKRLASSEEAAQQIFDNRYFQFASSRLGGVHEYMAAEKVWELSMSGKYDVVVVDTPPTRNALDFLRAPERMASLMDGAVMRWMSMPATKGGWRALEMGSEVVVRVLRKLVGESTIGEIAEFFNMFRDLWDGFHARSIDIHALLRGHQTKFLLVTSPAPSARSEALFFLELLRKQTMPFSGFVVNRTETTPEFQISPEQFPENGDIPNWSSICDAVANVVTVQSKLAKSYEQSINAIRSAGPPGAGIWLIPNQARPINQLHDLISLGDLLPKRADV
jgi:anion-transporting  ArsA/GET3 family ATPase